MTPAQQRRFDEEVEAISEALEDIGTAMAVLRANLAIAREQRRTAKLREQRRKQRQAA